MGYGEVFNKVATAQSSSVRSRSRLASRTEPMVTAWFGYQAGLTLLKKEIIVRIDLSTTHTSP